MVDEGGTVRILDFGLARLGPPVGTVDLGTDQLVAGWPMGLLRLRPDRPLRGLAGLFTASKPDDTDLFLVESFR
jgi:hypothetical protein